MTGSDILLHAKQLRALTDILTQIHDVKFDFLASIVAAERAGNAQIIQWVNVVRPPACTLRPGPPRASVAPRSRRASSRRGAWAGAVCCWVLLVL